MSTKIKIKTPFSGSEHVIAGSRLRLLIGNSHRLLRRKYRGSPLWALVSDLTGHGSTISAEICKQAEYDPNQMCVVQKLHNLK